MRVRALSAVAGLAVLAFLAPPSLAQVSDGGYRVFRPDGAGPHPAVALVSGCSGFKPAVAPKAYERVAENLRQQLHMFEVRGPDELDRAFATMTRQRVAAVFVVSEAMFILLRVRLAELEARHRLPSHGFREDVEAGALMSYGPSLKAIVEPVVLALKADKDASRFPMPRDEDLFGRRQAQEPNPQAIL